MYKNTNFERNYEYEPKLEEASNIHFKAFASVSAIVN